MPLDHTSILKTVEKRWNLPALTARDAAAQDIGDVLTLKTARTDDPLKGVKVPKSSGKDPAKGRPSHLQQVHAELVARLPVQDKKGNRIHQSPELNTSADYKAFIKARTAAWKTSRKGEGASDTQGTKKGAPQKTGKATTKKAAKRARKKS
jgi:phospholipase C